jgi:hypothetical protein
MGLSGIGTLPQYTSPCMAGQQGFGTYGRSPERLSACIDELLAAGGITRYNALGMLEVLRRPLDRLAEQLDADPQLVHRRFPELDCGSTGGRRLLLAKGARWRSCESEVPSRESITSF